MARSYKKTPIFGMTTVVSEKDDKRRANRRYRKAVRLAMFTHDAEADVLPDFDDIANSRNFSKDGKGYAHNASPKDMRK